MYCLQLGAGTGEVIRSFCYCICRHYSVEEYQVSSGYEWMIHDKVSFGSNLGVNQKKEVTTDQNNSVRVTKNVIPGNTKLQITVSSDTVKDNKYVISNGSKELYYTIRKAGETAEIIPGGAVLEVKNGTNSASQPLVFTLDTGSAETEDVVGTAQL